MITSEKYTILEYIPQNTNLITKLCILNFDIKSNINSVERLISDNPNTTFWCATKDFSKTFVQTAGKLGISNLISLPISTEVINNFFEEKIADNNDTVSNYIPLNNSSIMIVDDNEMNIKLLTDILVDLGIKIFSFKNPKEALEMAKYKKFDLLLLDILMPELSGFELAELIKNTEKNGTTPIIFISAISGTENVMNGYNIGACSYIEKPFHPNIVKAQIYNLLKLEDEKKNEEKNKENFIATLTHDLKSPINAEINALNLLINNKLENKNYKTEMLSELLNSAKYMKLITDKILCHYKQKHSNINLKPEKVCFSEIILSCISELKYLSDEKNITIRYSSPDNQIYTNVDTIEIKRAVNNLISNAIEYSYKNSYIDITLSKINNNLIFMIRDYGIGIDLNKHKHVFDEYMSLSKEHKRTGFGLGLSICKKIICAHNGDIKIESKPGNGTKIEFYLPIT